MGRRTCENCMKQKEVQEYIEYFPNTKTKYVYKLCKSCMKNFNGEWKNEDKKN